AGASLPHNIDLDIIRANALDLNIPRSSIKIRDIVGVLEDELQLGNSTATFLIPNYTPPITQALLNADIDNDGIVNTLDTSNGNTNSTIGNNRGTPVLQVNFDNLARGSYRESDLRSDFQVGTQGYNDSVRGPDNNAVDIVADPANSGRGNVMRVLHHAGVGGGSTLKEGGMRWRADLPPADEYYLAYDIYVANDWHDPHQFKMPGLINGTLLEASHSFEVTPHQSTLPAFSALVQMDRSDTGSGRPDYSIHGYYYDKHRVQRSDWLNTIDPTSEGIVGQYVMPAGQWVKIEQYMKLNTVNQRNGILRMWMDGVPALDITDHLWIADLSHPGNQVSNANRRIDGLWMYSYYGGNPSDPRNREHGDQYQYYDNFIVSDSPITH
ncbi:MAG: hypothetical protein JKX99_02415, partial [Robiginitomaculum sp.]|nr:hypothetical protein [Robiginitomaculum sp.]